MTTELYCPWCDTELITRTTLALGGDESWWWCKSCGREISEEDFTLAEL